MLNMFKRKDDSHEFKPILTEIEEEPVSPLGRTIFWLIISVIIILVLWMIIGKVDIVVTARGIAIPKGEEKIIQPLDTGVISRIFVKEGDYVEKGQVLVEIDPATTEPALDSLQKNLNQVNLEKQRISAEANHSGFFPKANNDYEAIRTQQDAYLANMAALSKQISIKRLQLSQLDEQQKALMSSLSNKQNLLYTNLEKEKRLKQVLDIIPRQQYEEVTQAISQYSSDIETLNFNIEETRQKKSQLIEEIALLQSSFRAENFKQLSEKQLQATEMEAQLKQVSYKNTRQSLISPVSGYVNKIAIHTIGGVITPAEKIMTIVPEDAELQVKATVLNQDIGFIEKGMPANIKIDTFNFQKYGVLKGVVDIISKNSINDEKLGPVYEVYITPENKSLLVEGREEHLSPGMSVSAEINVGKRRIIEFFIYPLIKYLDESIKVR